VPRLTAHPLVVSYLNSNAHTLEFTMNAIARILTAALASQFSLLACISSAGLGKPPGEENGGTASSVGGGPVSGSTGGATSVEPGVGGSPSVGGGLATGGSFVSAAGGTPVVGAGGGANTGGVAGVGGATFGTAGGCDFTSAACTQSVCTTVQSWEQTTCQSLLTCLQGNSACISAADPLCATKGTFGNPACQDYYSLSETGRVAVATFVKCACGFS